MGKTKQVGPKTEQKFRADWNAALSSIHKSLDADVYYVSGGLHAPAHEALRLCVEQYAAKPNCLLLLTTLGGDADVAYGMARCLQRKYENGRFVVFVSETCKSAGTLLTIGANELIMTDHSDLGPLDVQLGKPDELGEVISGLTPVQALKFLSDETFKLFEYYFLELMRRSDYRITTKTASEIASRITTGLFAPIYAQLDPMRLGEYRRDMMVAAEYGKRLDQGNLKTGEARSDPLQRLTHEYPSHGFVIDREEAQEIFNMVRPPERQETALAALLRPKILEDLTKQDSGGRYVATVLYLASLPEEENYEERESKSENFEQPSPKIAAPARDTDNIAGARKASIPTAKQEAETPAEGGDEEVVQEKISGTSG